MRKRKTVEESVPGCMSFFVSVLGGGCDTVRILGEGVLRV